HRRRSMSKGTSFSIVPNYSLGTDLNVTFQVDGVDYKTLFVPLSDYQKDPTTLIANLIKMVRSEADIPVPAVRVDMSKEPVMVMSDVQVDAKLASMEAEAVSSGDIKAV